MICLFGIVLLLTTDVLCQQLSSDVKQDILDIIYNLPVTFSDCSKTVVLPSNLNITLYTKEDSQNGTLLDNTNLKLVNPKNRLVYIIHGWLQTGSENWVIEMKDAYLNKTPANIIAVDWSFYAGINYGSSFCAVPQVGSFVGNLIYNLTIIGHAHLKNTQINGFSLGGQVAGYAGQEVQNKTNGSKIERINGLDAAGPGYLGLPLNERLDSSDASFVQGIHTSNYQFGYTPAYATVDFQVNYKAIPGCGAIQPGCPLTPGIPKDGGIEDLFPYLFCNHLRAISYFTESISSSDFIGTSCTGCRQFGLRQCKSSSTTIMGENCPATVSGEYYLSTNSQSPFAKGATGTK